MEIAVRMAMASVLQQPPSACMRCEPELHHKPVLSHRRNSIATWPSPLSLSGELSCSLRSSKRKELKQSALRPRWHSIQASVQPPLERNFLQASTMQEVYDKLAKRLFSAAIATSPPSKYIVGLAGPPGAGKSTCAKQVADRVNQLWRQAKANTDLEINSFDDVAIFLPMDGFHLYRYQLDMMEDPAEAHARRGAPWTFDPDGLIRCLKTLRKQGCVSAPSFDHGVGDPKENDIIVNTSHRVIVVEGNYLLLNDDKWKGLLDLFDERWFLDIDIETTLNRVYERFLMLGIPPEQARKRLDYNDRENAELILGTKEFADLIIKSIDFKIH